jgi:hypothetical protein
MLTVLAHMYYNVSDRIALEQANTAAESFLRKQKVGKLPGGVVPWSLKRAAASPGALPPFGFRGQ